MKKPAPHPTTTTTTTTTTSPTTTTTIPATTPKQGPSMQINVKDFGAVGDGSADDTAAIQAAVNWTTATGFRAIIFFPVGTYKVTTTINLPSIIGAECSIIIRGSGMASRIQASGFTGYVFQRLSWDGTGYPAHSGLFIFEDLYLAAAAGAGIGGFKIQGVEVVVFQKLILVGLNIGIYIGVSNFNVAVRDCELKGGITPPIPGSIGILNGCTAAEITGGAGPTQGVQIENVTVTNYENGQRHGGAAYIRNYRSEENNVGVLCGIDPVGAASSLDLRIEGMGAESCDYAVKGSWNRGTIDGLVITSDGNDSAGKAVNCIAGIYAHNIAYSRISNVNVIGPYQVGGIVVDNSGSQGNWLGVKFERCTAALRLTVGKGWILPSADNYRAGVKFEQCDNPPYPIKFSDLPGQAASNMTLEGFNATEGMEYDLFDSNTATWGSVVAGGGANHIRARFNGTAWTVAGK